MTNNPRQRLISRGAILALSLLFVPTFAGNGWANTIPTVPVGNAGNAGDVQSQGTFGAVAKNYYIGKTEVTVGQYTAFLNAVAKTDTYGLYNTQMANDLSIAGIKRDGVSGSYEYSVIGSPNKPVTYVSWGDAARFANWLHNGQPTGNQDSGTTEDGAYPLNGATTSAALDAVTRKDGAVWFIPTENEWYKAAYHKNDGVTGNYWDYPTSTDAIPYSDQPPGSDAPTQANTANFHRNDFVANGYNDGFAVSGTLLAPSGVNLLTDVGAYVDSTSPYGTYDQGGNAMEWNETLIGSGRGIRGGSFSHTNAYLATSISASLTSISSTTESFAIGFRVATVPEPGTSTLAIVGGVLVLWWHRKRK